LTAYCRNVENNLPGSSIFVVIKESSSKDSTVERNFVYYYSHELERLKFSFLNMETTKSCFHYVFHDSKGKEYFNQGNRVINFNIISVMVMGGMVDYLMNFVIN
jgi:hypothetical protein